MPVSSCSFSAAIPEGAAPSTGDTGRAERVGRGARRGRLARPGETDDADDAIGARADEADHLPLLVRERRRAGERLVDDSLHDGRCASADAALDEIERGALRRDSSAVE